MLSTEIIGAEQHANEPAHTPAKCTGCGGELAFLEYGSKVGKNGKMAKWPVYAKCHRDSCKIGRKNLGLHEEEKRVEPKPLNLPPPGPSYKLFQLTNRVNPPLIFDDLLDALGGQPGTIKMSQDDMDLIKQVCNDAISKLVSPREFEGALWLGMAKKPIIKIEPADWKVTKGWGYFTVERPS